MYMEKVSNFPHPPKRQTAIKTSSAHTAGLFAPQDTAKEDPGEHIYYRTYSHTVVHTKTVRARTYSFAAAENGLSMKQATARFGDVQSIQTLYSVLSLAWKIIFDKDI